MVVALQLGQTIPAVGTALRHWQTLQVAHQSVDRGAHFVDVQTLHLFEHKFWHQFAILCGRYGQFESCSIH